MENSLSYQLKRFREHCNLSVEDVVAQLSEKGISISPKTLYGYENGVSLPKVSIFLALCDIYNITDPLYAFGYSSSHSNSLRLSDQEFEMILAFRKQPQTVRSFILQSLGLPTSDSIGKNA